ncbi:MAG: DUF1295 domain-containing protein [Methylophilaceae bacterium]
MNWVIYTDCLLAISAFGLLGWFVNLARSNVTHVDSMWSLFFCLTAYTTALFSEGLSTRAAIVIALVTIWAARLCVYLTWRNWGPHEDLRYAEIRKNNEPYFWLKSIYIVFGLQALLAWVISISLYAAIDSNVPIKSLDYLAIILFVFGFIWEVMADKQLSKFKSNPQNKDKVLNTGVWRYSRHPNYFGECCIWWSFYLFSLATGAWWTIISPLLMTLLLLKVSGVSLLEKTIVSRRPAYAEYTRNTNAFIPGLPKE